MNEFELRRALRGMARERSPQRDLWPAIAATIDRAAAQPGRRVRRSGWLPLALAASILGAVIALWPPAVEHAPMVAGAEPPVPTPAVPGVEARALLRQADSMSLEYRVVLAQLAEAPLPPELRAIARELRDSEQTLREALRQKPESLYLLGQLRRNYEQQLRVSQLAALG